ncbi:MAG TPA: hypothetical protein DD393_07595 [Ruminococcaceae bacterium]|jgi:hypothetical protein|nr:hypothetical protein [Oscillospiraceae bacterium]
MGFNMKKRVRIILVIIVIFVMITTNVYAYDYPTYDVTLNSGDVVKAYQYSEERFNGEYDPEFKCVKTVTINALGEEPIVIKESAFSGSVTRQVESLIINGTGKIILSSFAFSYTGITDIDIPSNVVFESGAECVFEASFLRRATIRSDLCPAMFQECYSLNYVNFLNPNIKKIPANCFDTCGLLSITIPSSVTEIEDGAFYSTFYLERVNLNEGLESIGNRSFENSNSIKELKFPSTLKSIGEKSFYETSSLVKLELNDGLETIGENAFLGCRSLKSVTIPASVTSIGEKAFGYYTTEKNEYKKYDGFTIYGYRGTAAETYATENGFTFIPLDSVSSVMGVTYTPSWSSVNDYSFSVDGRPLKLQVIEATGATRTFSRHASNVVIKAYDEQGNEVHDTSADLAYEVWTVKTRLTPNSSLKIHAKYDNVWEDQTYDFSISTLYSDTTLKSAELAETSGKQSAVDCKIVTGSGVNKVRIEYEDGMTTTVNSSMAVLDETNMTYTYNLSVKTRHIGENSFKVYIKTPTDGWKYATTLTYTVE